VHLRKSLTKVKAHSANNFYTEEKNRKQENSNVKIGNSFGRLIRLREIIKDGTPCAVKIARTVGSGGKAGVV